MHVVVCVRTKQVSMYQVPGTTTTVVVVYWYYYYTYVYTVSENARCILCSYSGRASISLHYYYLHHIPYYEGGTSHVSAISYVRAVVIYFVFCSYDVVLKKKRYQPTHTTTHYLPLSTVGCCCCCCCYIIGGAPAACLPLSCFFVLFFLFLLR